MHDLVINGKRYDESRLFLCKIGYYVVDNSCTFICIACVFSRRRVDDAGADIVFVLTTTCSPLDLMAQIFVE